MLRGCREADFSGMSLSWWRRAAGQTMAEYAIVLAVITPAIILAFGVLSGAIVPSIENVLSYL
jgi:Flp pilus assembly pilin Flp